MLISYVFIFRQKKLEKVMEEEGLKDEEVINIGKFSLKPEVSYHLLEFLETNGKYLPIHNS